MAGRVTKGKHGGSLWVIKKNGREVAYALTKTEAERKQKAIRDGVWGR